MFPHPRWQEEIISNFYSISLGALKSLSLLHDVDAYVEHAFIIKSHSTSHSQNAELKRRGAQQMLDKQDLTLFSSQLGAALLPRK